ncbi:TadE/TadG family type IV pilus assembly protein [Wenxinia marina]|uniref:TadE-like protein n=1 Tax=Wenxinia marina DSM 24838 TaxID=1123501 RepID=A0A0D0NJ34_9RHOB|nr:hypothetical protein [Wenxinia marina]KIQ68355.1 hypothetical protein Wenmar_03002 [Wenxinia marina DSM 24838]GGL72836.1 hypothetical protein GCM10011392_29340 [Wenxinia marina]
MIKRLPGALARRLRAEEGSVTVEAVIMLPALIWCYLGTFVFFDAYRAQTVNIKTGYTIGDTLSREQTLITERYIDSLYELQTLAVNTDQDVALRVTVIGYDADEDAFTVAWSRTRGGPDELDAATVNAARDRIPTMSEVDHTIVVETWVDYAPAFQVGIDPFTFEDFVTVRPRSGGTLCFDPVGDGDILDALC